MDVTGRDRERESRVANDRWLLVAVAVGITVLSSAVGFASRVREAMSGPDAPPFLDAGLADALEWLAQQTAWTDAVLTPPGLGHWVPARAGNVVYLGALGLSGAAETLDVDARRFYAGNAGSTWLAEHRIRYVLVTPAHAETVRARGFLEPRFTARGYTVYERIGETTEARTVR